MSDRRIGDLALDSDDGGEHDEFARYIEDGTPMQREMTQDEATWVYLNLK